MTIAQRILSQVGLAIAQLLHLITALASRLSAAELDDLLLELPTSSPDIGQLNKKRHVGSCMSAWTTIPVLLKVSGTTGLQQSQKTWLHSHGLFPIHEPAAAACLNCLRQEG